MLKSALIRAVVQVTEKWAKQRKREERDAECAMRRHQALVRQPRMTFKDAAWQALPAAYRKASSDNQYPAHARQIMYAARGEIQRMTGKLLNDQYFCQTLLPDFMAERRDLTADWDVVFDARGHFTEPHTDVVVPLGTLDVRNYLAEVSDHRASPLVCDMPEGLFPTCGPEYRFGAILFIEKEGFTPLFRAARLAARYDIAIMSTKGLSVTASRWLVDQLCARHDIPLLVLHDFDKSGFSIIGTLRRDTRRYEFANEITVIDLGLRLVDVEQWQLEAEDVGYGKSDPVENLWENGATEEEIAYLCRGRNSTSDYVGQRVELNAFSSGNLIAWIEAKLQEHGINKVVPSNEVLTSAYRRCWQGERMRERMRTVLGSVRSEAAQLPVPVDLDDRVQAQLAAHPELAWDEVIANLVRTGHEAKEYR